MPLFYQHNINATTKLGVWRIDEDEDFFLEKVPLKNDVSHPIKRLQHLAGRYLLPVLFDDFPLEEILIADTKKPFLANERYHFSISHCGNFAAAMVSSDKRVGVDIESVTSRIMHISPKFLGAQENIFLNEDYEMFLEQWGMKEKVYTEFLTLNWCSKEAIYKWYGRGRVDFKEHIRMRGNIIFRQNQWMALPFIFTCEEPVYLTVHAKIFDDLVLAWVAT
jgi:phosphopantetheinyl transferase